MRWCPDGDFWRLFCVLCFQRAACSRFQTCILNLHWGHTMCGSMANIQSAAAEIRRGKKRRRTNHSMKIYMVSLLHRATINNEKEVKTDWHRRPGPSQLHECSPVWGRKSTVGRTCETVRLKPGPSLFHPWARCETARELWMMGVVNWHGKMMWQVS